VNNFKWGIIASISAFAVSVLLGIVFRVGISHIFIRAIIFTVVFFGLGFGLRLLINSYFPEILSPDGGLGGDAYGQTEDGQAGRVNIVMDNTGEYAVPELYKTPENPQEMGNIHDLLLGGGYKRNGNGYQSKGIDANKEEGYNSAGGSQDLSFSTPEEVPYMDDYQESPSSGNAADVKPVFSPSFGDDGGMGGLPDLDMMAMAFSGFGSAPPAGAPAASAASQASFVPTTMPIAEMEEMEPAAPPPKRNTGNKPEPIKGDFSPKELAEGIRAVLSKDK